MAKISLFSAVLCGFVMGTSFDTTLVFRNQGRWAIKIADVPQIGAVLGLSEMMTTSCPGYYTMYLLTDTSIGNHSFAHPLIKRTITCGSQDPRLNTYWEVNHDSAEYHMDSLHDGWTLKILDSIKNNGDTTFTIKFAFLDKNNSIEKSNQSTKDISLSISPNPFNAGTKFSFTLYKKMRVRLTLYDLGGKFIAELTDSIFDKGIHHHNLVVNNLSSGIYLVRIAGEGQIHTRMVTLL